MKHIDAIPKIVDYLSEQYSKLLKPPCSIELTPTTVAEAVGWHATQVGKVAGKVCEKLKQREINCSYIIQKKYFLLEKK